MPSIRELLERLAELTIGADAAALRPGMPEAEVRARAVASGLDIPAEVVELFTAFDGQVEHSEGVLFGSALMQWEHVLLVRSGSLADAEAIGSDAPMRATVDAYDRVRVRQTMFDRGWLPITDLQGATMMCIDLAPEGEGRVGQVIRAGYQWDDRRVLAPSVRALLERLVELAEGGEFGIRGDLRPGFDGQVDIGLLPDFVSPEYALDHVREPFLGDLRTHDERDDWTRRLDPRWREWFMSKPAGFADRQREASVWKPRGTDGPDLEPARWMPRLTELDLSQFPIESIDEIPDIPQLAQLTLGAIPSLEGIGRFTRLMRLNLTIEQEYDLAPLAGSRELRGVWSTGFVRSVEALPANASVAVDVTVRSRADIDRAVRTPRLGWLILRTVGDLDLCDADWALATDLHTLDLRGGRVGDLQRLTAPQLGDIFLNKQVQLDFTHIGSIARLWRVWVTDPPTDVIAVDALRHLPPRVHVYAQELLGVWDYSSGDAQL